MNIFKELDYRRSLISLVKERKGGHRRWSFQGLAEAIRVPKSYISRVIHGDADLNHDQLFLACEYLELTADESAFLDLLLQYERCGLEKRRTTLRGEIKKAQSKYLDLGKQLKSKQTFEEIPIQSEFYLNPLYQLVHSALSIPRYQSDFSALATALHLNREQLQDVIHRLERMGLCEQKEGKAIAYEVNFHLPKNSPISQAWQTQLRLLAMQRMQMLSRDDFYSYSVVFSGDKNTDGNIRQLFLEFLKTVQANVEHSVPERTFQLNLDLIPWA